MSEAAERLGVHPQRIYQRIKAGSLPVHMVGQRTLIDEKDLQRVRHPTQGRPWSARSAWMAMAWAADLDLSAATRPDRSKVRPRVTSLVEKVAGEGDEVRAAAAVLAHMLRPRAERHALKASRRDLPDLPDDERVELAGVSLSVAGVSAGEVVEGYVFEADYAAFVDDYLLTPVAADQANVIVHVPRSACTLNDLLVLAGALNGDSLVPQEQAADSAPLPRSPGAMGGVLSHPRGQDDVVVDVEFAWRMVLHSPLLLAADLAEHDGIREQNQAVQLTRQFAEQLREHRNHVAESRP